MEEKINKLLDLIKKNGDACPDYEKIKELTPLVRFEIWERYDESHSVVRFATSWATTSEDIESLAKII